VAEIVFSSAQEQLSGFDQNAAKAGENDFNKASKATHREDIEIVV
jgi:hypothetical protein